MRSATPLLIVTFLLPAAVGAQDEIVLRGNQAYQEGDFPAAIEAYEAVQEAGFTSAGLEYNLGNAYFKLGELGPAILHWERALVLDPGEADAQANLELARTLTTDAIEPLPVFWLFSVATWWVDLLPRSLLLVLVSLGWLGTTGGIVLRFLARGDTGHRMGTWISVVGVVVVVLLGANLVARELGIGRAERAVVMVDAVAVRSAPAQDDDLTLFEVHEGTSVRLDQTTGSWAEVVLDDGKVGWVPLSAMEII